MSVQILAGDCREVMRSLADASVDAIVTDPPYELAFMGRRWDASGIAYSPAVWAQALRVLKPGGHLAAFGGTRTYHRMACAIEDAGFEIRDSLHWIYGSGFPKSMDVSKAIDKAAGAEREVIGINEDYLRRKPNGMKTEGASTYGYSKSQYETDARITAPATTAAKQWEGWGTALKPAHEPIVLARKPLTGTVAENVLEHGTGALNIGACRVEGLKDTPASPRRAKQGVTYGELGNDPGTGTGWDPTVGRWPPNVLFDDAAAAELDRQSGTLTSGANTVKRASSSAREGNRGAAYGTESRPDGSPMIFYGDSGGASRFFPVFRYQAKAPASERPRLEDGTAHPTVKPVALMRWLVRLVTSSGGIVLDPFAGTGTTGEACLDEGMNCILIEQDEDYLKLIGERFSRREPTLF